MMSISFNKDKITDIPLILPIEMFIIEDRTVAPEFKKEINEIIPDMVQENKAEQEESPQANEIKNKEQSETLEVEEEILADESNDLKTDFIIKKETKLLEVIEKNKTEEINDLEVKIKEKPKPKEILIEKKIETVLKKKPKKKSFEISKVLKDIENEQKDFKKNQKKIKEKQEDVFTEQVAASMTISEVELLKQQLYSCLTIPAGSKYLQDMVVILNIKVNPDRTVSKATIKDKSKMNDPYFRTAAESAIRAVNHPNCSPLLLPEDKYDEWKEINFTFDFSWMFDKN